MISKSPIVAWRNRAHRYELEGVMCRSCQKKYYPVRYTCTCGSTSFEKNLLSRQGILVSFSTVTVAPQEFSAMVPYCIGMIQLDDGPRLIAQLTDVMFDDLVIGMRMVATFRKYHVSGPQGLIHYGFKFKPQEQL